ncbi:S8 family serine peptidase [Chrysosporum ovalisporum TAC611]|nr:S8 family serine peptidase [Umezakia ovalisporum TAC611]
MEYATAQGVKLTNNSWGGGGYSQGLYDAIAAAGDAGSLFIAAAGNESNNNDSSPSYPASYNLDNIISVAAITHWDGLSWFSNYGLTTVDLGAPGSSIYSTVPGNSYDTYSGTSMASPHVAGAAALLWSENPTWTAQQVKDVLLQTVDPTETLNGITVSGGRLNVYNALLGTTTTLPSGTVEFAPGETTKEITVYVSGDTDLEGDEGFSVTLSDAEDAIINTDTAEGIILNDDSDMPPPTLDIAPLNAVQGEGNTGTTPFTFTVTRSGDTTGTSTVNWAVTLSGGADAADFSLIPAFINTADGLREIVGSGINPAGVDFSPTSRPTITPTSNPSIINAIDTGWYDSTGWHAGGHTNYALGGFYLWNSYYRNWIAFDLPTFTTPVTAAQLQIRTYDYNSSHDLSETYELRDVTTPISTLRAGGEGLTSIYDDLGDGTVYGSRDFSPGDSYTTVTIDLNSSLVNTLNAKSGQQFALGGQITTLDGIDNNEFIFGSSGGNPGDDVQLLLTYGNPLPSGTVEFAPGETTKEITVYVSGDTDLEGDEGFSVTLSDAVDAIINTDTAEGIIVNDDTAIDNAQKITSSSNISAAPGGTVTIPLYYDTTTGDNSLPGISLRLHYNSSELTFNNASDLFLTNLFGDVKDLPDNGNFDSDVITDRFLQLQYNDFTGNWPNQPLPLKLADFKFTTTDSFTGTQVNFSSSNTAAGYGLAANSVTVSQGWNLDIDGSGEIKALSDGVILMRHLFGSFIGNDLIDGAIDPNATRDLVAIQAYLQEGVNQGHLDMDGNGSVGAYSDGIIAVRYMFGTFPGDALIHEVLSPDATRDLAQIQNHLEQLTTLV